MALIVVSAGTVFAADQQPQTAPSSRTAYKIREQPLGPYHGKSLTPVVSKDGRHLAYLTILTESTAEIATRRRYRKTLRAGLKMKQGFFFDGVGICRTDLVINKRIQHAVNVFSYPAKAGFTFSDRAPVSTQAAVYLTILSFVPKYSFF